VYKDFEVILISENNINNYYSKIFKKIKIKKIYTKFKTPGEKRHYAAIKNKCEYLIFLDDDAIANKNWLLTINNTIKKYKYEIFGGPAIDRLDENKLSIRILSFIFKTKFFGGFPERYTKLKKKTVNDWPSVNFIIKKSVYLETNGFNYKFWPGEDSLLCNEIFYRLKKKIFYIPKAFVYHKRRPTIKSHFKQISGYAKMRGRFLIKKIENSQSLKYSIPSIFLLYNFLFFSKLINNHNYLKYFSLPLITYFILNLLISCRTIISLKEKFILLPLFIIGNYINHIVYGTFYVYGIFYQLIMNRNY
jgi:GT2 family glycosyltransferase